MMHASTRELLDDEWLFGGPIPNPGAEDRLTAGVIAAYAGTELDDSGWERVTLPHVVTELSWRTWDPARWEKVWAYRRRLEVEHVPGTRVFLEFDAAMTNATVSLDGEVVATHLGGYLPFRFEITEQVAAAKANVLAVALDSRFNVNVPPNLPAPAPTTSIDYLQPGGIHRSVWLVRSPDIFVSELALTNFDALDAAARRTEAVVTIDARDAAVDGELRVSVLDREGQEVTAVTVTAAAGETTVRLDDLADVELWDVDSPVLYEVRAELRQGDATTHSLTRRTGYREARFELDGFYLNGRRRYLFGFNRHGYFPYAGFAMPDRAHRKDAEILKEQLNSVMVRCAHYPQTESFLDACDELGLLVWEESPGWQYVGDSVWQDRAVDDITAMIARDRHRPSIVIWGARLNETPDRPEFYARTEALVKSLDSTRQTSGTMFAEHSREQNFQHDVFSYDDYHTEIGPDGERRPLLLDPVEDRPYLLSEALSTRSSPTTFYRRIDEARVQQHQAMDYAHANDVAMGDPRFSGLLAWAAFDYQANMGNHYRGIKTSGLGDVFRELKPGAAIYRAQIDPSVRPVIEPAFVWEPLEFRQRQSFSGRQEHRNWGPGAHAMICSNLDRLDVYLGDRLVDSVAPDRDRFANLPYAPSFVDLTLREEDGVDLRIEGFVGEKRVLTRRMSGEREFDTLDLAADDASIVADGRDATRVVVRMADKFGNSRGSSHAVVELSVDGPARLVGDAVLDLSETGGVAAVWIRSLPGNTGTIHVRAESPEYGAEVVTIDSTQEEVQR